MRLAKPFRFGEIMVKPGDRVVTDLTLPRLNSRTDLAMPVHIVHGRYQGPCMFISSAIHGDEINGIEITQRLLEYKGLKHLRGTLLIVPVVNVYGMIHQSRYLPDRRDLNRSFPGSEKGSLTARVAYLFKNEIISCCTHGIDLHTGAIHRSNLPQIRANLEDKRVEAMARVFGAPVMLSSNIREGTLRQTAMDMDIPVLLYEAGEALRYDELSIRAGFQGIINVMREISMLRPVKKSSKHIEPFVAYNSGWVRAPESGMLRYPVALGTQVKRNDILGYISDPYSGEMVEIQSPWRGIVIGNIQIPMAHEGEALFHIARFREDNDDVVETVDLFNQNYMEIDVDTFM